MSRLRRRMARGEWPRRRAAAFVGAGGRLIRDEHGGVALDVLVTPRAARERLGPVVDVHLKIAVTAPPGRGQRRRLPAPCPCPAPPGDAVTVLRGESGRHNTVQVRGVVRAAVEALVAGR